MSSPKIYWDYLNTGTNYTYLGFQLGSMILYGYMDNYLFSNQFLFGDLNYYLEKPVLGSNLHTGTISQLFEQRNCGNIFIDKNQYFSSQF